MSDSQQPNRWGKPLSFAEADALASRYSEGDLLPLTELWARFRAKIEEFADATDKKTRYYKLGQIRQYMEDMGLTELEEEVDDNVLTQTICESVCIKKCEEFTGPDLDECYWPCMHSCSPVEEAFVDGTPPPSTIDPSKVGLTAYSLAPSGLLVPKNTGRRKKTGV